MFCHKCYLLVVSWLLKKRVKELLYTPCPWSWRQLQLVRKNDCNAFLMVHCCFYTWPGTQRIHGAHCLNSWQSNMEQRPLCTIQSDLQKIVNCGGCICYKRPHFALSLCITTETEFFNSQPFWSNQLPGFLFSKFILKIIICMYLF